MNTAQYDDAYFDVISPGSSASAQIIARHLLSLFPIRSVLDVGCGRGAWLAEWRALGVSDQMGLDGGAFDARRLLIPEALFRRANLSAPFDAGRVFDLVQSLEVAEHIDPADAETFVDTLTRHGEAVLFSAAPPGQGGVGHVNEQPLAYWRAAFRARGFAAYDAVRPFVATRKDVEPWYRYNTLLYVKKGSALEGRLAPYAVRDETALKNFQPLHWRARLFLFQRLGSGAVERIAGAKHRVKRLIERKNAGAR